MARIYEVEIVSRTNGDAQQIASVTGDGAFVYRWLIAMAETILGEGAPEPDEGADPGGS